MSGLKTIIFSIVGTFIAFIIIGAIAWTFFSEYITNERYILDIIGKINEFMQLPDTVLEQYSDEIENIVTILDILKNPETTKILADIYAGLVPVLNMQPYIGRAMNSISAAINNGITTIGNSVVNEIHTQLEAEGARMLGNLDVPMVILRIINSQLPF
jgi:hypothetical protein